MTTLQTRADKKADRVAARVAAAKTKADERQRINDAKLVNSKADKQAALAEFDKTVAPQINSLIEKINREEDAAQDQFNKHAGESTTFRTTLAKVLADAGPLIKRAGMTLKEVKAKYVGDRIGKTQFKQILRVARGAITFQQIKQGEAAKKQQQRAAKAVGTSRPANGNGAEPPDLSADVRMAEAGNEQARKRLIEAGYTQGEDGSTGKPTFTPPVRVTASPEYEQLSEAIAAPKPNPVPVETAEEKSDRLLKEWKERMAGMLDGMNEDDFKSAVAWWSTYLKKRTTVLPARKQAA